MPAKLFYKMYFLFILMTCTSAYAGLVVEQTLDFGTLVITDNNSVSQVSVPLAGNSISTNKIYITRQGRPAELLFFSYPAYTSLSFSPVFPVQSTNSFGDSEQFILTQVFIPTTVTTNSAGEAFVKMGGTIETSGSGQPYINTNFQFVISVVVTY